MSEQNKKMIRRLLEEVWSNGELSLLSELVAQDFVGHFTPHPEPITGLGAYREFIAMYQGAFQETRLIVEQQIAEGDMIATRWTAHVRESAESAGGVDDSTDSDLVNVMGISLYKFANGKIVESWDSWDTLSLLQSESGPDVLESLSITI